MAQPALKALGGGVSLTGWRYLAGTPEPGKLADLVVLSDDYFTCRMRS